MSGDRQTPCAARAVFREEYGAPADVIVDVAEAVDADWIVIGTHGRQRLDRVLMGSVSTAVMHRARKVVWVVR